MMQVDIRELTIADVEDKSDAVRWILRTWCRSYAAAARKCGVMRGNKDPGYWQQQDRTMHSILRRPHARVLVASVPDEPDVFVGWAVAEPGTLHYVSVKPVFQKLGVARQLVQYVESGTGCDVEQYTHAGPKTLMEWADNRGWRYQPMAR